MCWKAYSTVICLASKGNEMLAAYTSHDLTVKYVLPCDICWTKSSRQAELQYQTTSVGYTLHFIKLVAVICSWIDLQVFSGCT